MMLKVTLTAEECVRDDLPPGEYCVKFFHGYGGYGDTAERVGQRFTQCSIAWIREEGDSGMARGVGGSDRLGMVSARAVCHPLDEDEYNGETGQRIALDRVLQSMFPNVTHPLPCHGAVHRDTEFIGQSERHLNSRLKATRTKFWDAYWKRFRRGKAPTLRERLLRAHGECCRCHGDGPPCEQRMCAACSMLHWTIGQGVMPGQKIDCWKCGFPACSKREARYAPRKKENPNE